ncbi:hypothetical protein PsorP6_008382 [Peronosclerospora sorghi]|uniref:Uncharacterized protein n=1 Tax=Peronosclerospora sorghi TaxID=230839 RepID=A0ACC0WBA9_9STRA|nr:hypothetical protein PsorP6_008382 [Peronosclerospora sorghi]
MGRYQREYERDWRDITRQAIAERFGASALTSFSCVTQSDERELREILATAGIAHVPPNHSRWYAPLSQTFSVASDHHNSLLSEDSYVYNTPPASPSQSTFPTFSSQEFASHWTSERRVSGSQRLQLQQAGVSPIAESRRTSIENAGRISPPSGPAKSPWSPGQRSVKPTRKTRQTPRRSLESSFLVDGDLDASMLVMPLSEKEQTHDDEVQESNVASTGQKKNAVRQEQEHEQVLEQVKMATTAENSVDDGDHDADEMSATKELVFRSDSDVEEVKQGQINDNTQINAETISDKEKDSIADLDKSKGTVRGPTLTDYTETASGGFEPDVELGPENGDNSDGQVSNDGKQGVETRALIQIGVERAPQLPLAFQSIGEPSQENGQDLTPLRYQVSTAKDKHIRKEQVRSTKRATAPFPTSSVAKRALAAPANSSAKVNIVGTSPKISSAHRKRRFASPTASSPRQTLLALTSSTSHAAMASSLTRRAAPTSSTLPTSSKSTLPRKRVKPSALFHTKLPLQVEYRFASDQRRHHKRRRKSHAIKPSVFPYVVPELLVELQPYQKEALHWMLDRERECGDAITIDQLRRGEATAVDALVSKICGGILADEMGLGKTICCLALICESLRLARAAAAQTSTETGNTVPRLTPPTLIVTPLSILSQWEHEIRAKTNLNVVSYQGVSRKKFRSATQFMGVDIVLSTYDTLRLLECKTQVHDSEKDGIRGTNDDDTGTDAGWRQAPRLTPWSKKPVLTSKLHQMQWFRIILDESHLIANAGCGRARAAFTLSSRRRWCVTGTPIQNRTADLAALLQFVGLGTRAHSLSENELGALLPRIVLRRLKSTVNASSCTPILALPNKSEEIIELEFASDVERVLYMLLHRFTKRQVIRYLQAKETRRTNQTTRLSTPSKDDEHHPQFMHVFELILRLRQVCDACGLMTADPFGEIQKRIKNVEALVGNAGADGISPFSAEEAEMIERLRMWRLDANSESGRILSDSTKLSALIKELRAVRARRERVLVISEWTSFLDMIGECLMVYNAQCETRASCLVDASEGDETILFAKLDGRMAARDREQVIRRFQEQQEDRAVAGPPLDVLLLSLRTGGLGLNLTAATHVFIMEPSWNPSLERQAIDRAHRFGQTKDVRVVRFIIKGSIEERVVALQDKKRQLTAACLGDGDLLSSAKKNRLCDPRLSPGDLKRLFFTPDEEEGCDSQEDVDSDVCENNGGQSDITCIEISDGES